MVTETLRFKVFMLLDQELLQFFLVLELIDVNTLEDRVTKEGISIGCLVDDCE